MTLVLIIDDFFEIRKVLEAMLGSQGIESLSASDGEKGLALLSSSLHPDLVISDISMPGMDGMELFRKIQQVGKLPGVPWIFMSSADRRRDAQEAGCAYFLEKPFTRDDLKRAMACALDRSRVSAV